MLVDNAVAGRRGCEGRQGNKQTEETTTAEEGKVDGQKHSGGRGRGRWRVKQMRPWRADGVNKERGTKTRRAEESRGGEGEGDDNKDEDKDEDKDGEGDNKEEDKGVNNEVV